MTSTMTSAINGGVAAGPLPVGHEHVSVSLGRRYRWPT